MILKHILDNLYDGINVQVSVFLVDGIEPKESATVTVRLYTSTTRQLCGLERKVKESKRGKTTVQQRSKTRTACFREVK